MRRGDSASIQNWPKSARFLGIARRVSVAPTVQSADVCRKRLPQPNTAVDAEDRFLSRTLRRPTAVSRCRWKLPRSWNARASCPTQCGSWRKWSGVCSALHPTQRAANYLPVLHQSRTQQEHCRAGRESGNVRGGRARTQEHLRRPHREDPPDHDLVHHCDSLRPRTRGARHPSQHLRSPRRRRHIEERASQKPIIGARGVIRRTAPVAGDHVRGHVGRHVAEAAPRRAGIVVVQAIAKRLAVQGTINSLRSA